MAVDWDGLERALFAAAGTSSAYLDVHTGEVFWLTDGWSEDHAFSEEELAFGLASGRLFAIEPLPPATERSWMCAFTEGLDDDWPRDALREALAEAAATRAFEAALGRFPQERLAWLGCRDAHVVGELRGWLQANGLEPTTERVRPRLRR